MILRGDMCWGKTPDIVARQILDRGYILADFNRCEFAPDRTHGRRRIVRRVPRP